MMCHETLTTNEGDDVQKFLNEFVFEDDIINEELNAIFEKELPSLITEMHKETIHKKGRMDNTRPSLSISKSTKMQ